jgi:hypothetical protein
VQPKFIRTEGTQHVFTFSLAPEQAVLLQPAGSVRLTPPYVLKAVSWPPIDGASVENYWGKHYRAQLPPHPAPPAPPPPGPHPPSPAPRITCNSSSALPAGYECYSNACNIDSGALHGGTCGGSICEPQLMQHARAKSEPVPPAALALCATVSDEHGNATAIAAARCNAYAGCNSFGTNPIYEPGSCHDDPGPEPVTNGVCFKFFRSAAGNRTKGKGWTLFAKNINQR